MDSEEECKRAYEDGLKAFADGKTGDDNPYPPASSLHKDWEHGFLDSQKRRDDSDPGPVPVKH